MENTTHIYQHAVINTLCLTLLVLFALSLSPPPPTISFQGPPGHGGLPGANGNDGAKGARGDEGAQGEPGVPGVNVSDQHLQQRIFSNLALPVYS